MANKKIVIDLTAPSVFLGVTFVVLKVTNCVTRSWLWVLSPFWWLFAILTAISIVAATLFVWVAGVIYVNRLFQKLTNKWRK